MLGAVVVVIFNLLLLLVLFVRNHRWRARLGDAESA
jgi:hypothetical protein